MIPEGMSATQALKNQYFVAIYNQLRDETTMQIEQFIQVNHYRPPYWQLVKLARNANEKIREH